VTRRGAALALFSLSGDIKNAALWATIYAHVWILNGAKISIISETTKFFGNFFSNPAYAAPLP